MRSNVTAFRRRRQLSGWLDDLASKVVDQGKVALDDAIKQKSSQVGGDHIAQQNWTVDQFRQILDAVNGGTLEPARASALVESLAANFEQFATSYGPRGFQGGRDVRNLANQIKQSLGATFNLQGGTFSRTISENLPLIALAAGGLFLMSRRRR